MSSNNPPPGPHPGDNPQPDRSTASSGEPEIEPRNAARSWPLDPAQFGAAASLGEPNFLHPLSIVFEVGSHLRRFLFPAVIAVYSAASGGFWGLAVGLLLLGGALVTTLVRYFTLRYRIQGNELVVTEGLLFRRVRSVPVRRIQNVDLVQNVLHRLLGVAEVRIETASGTEHEATLRVLGHAQIEGLRQAIFGAERSGVETAAVVSADTARPGDTDAVAPPAPVDSRPGVRSSAGQAAHQLVHQIPLRHLVAAGLASNRGTVLLGILFGLFFQGGFDSRGAADRLVDSGWWNRFADRFQDALPGEASGLGLGLLIALGVLVIFLCLRLFGVAWYVLRFYGHRLTRQGNDLRISCGLFTKVSATVPRGRIQLISVHRSLLMRWMRLAAIRIETAGGSGADNEDAAATVSRRWFLPVIAENDVVPLLRELRPGSEWDERQFHWHSVSPWTARRLMRAAVVVSVLLSGVGMAMWWPWGATAGLVSLPLLSYWAVKKSRSMRYARTEWGVAYRSGIFTRKMSFAFYDRMQTIGYYQSPWDRRWKMAALWVDTAAAGPADHVIDVAYLDADFAAAQFDELQTIAAQHRPSWG